MGFISADKVHVHTSKEGRLCIKVPITNKNNAPDDLYIEINKDILCKLLANTKIDETEFNTLLAKILGGRSPPPLSKSSLSTL